MEAQFRRLIAMKLFAIPFALFGRETVAALHSVLLECVRKVRHKLCLGFRNDCLQIEPPDLSLSELFPGSTKELTLP